MGGQALSAEALAGIDVYRWTNHRQIHVRGHTEEGTTTTPFDYTREHGEDDPAASGWTWPGRGD